MSKAVAAASLGFLVSTCLVLTVLSQTGGAVQPPVSAEMMRLGSRGIRVHDPSTIVQDGNVFWVFYTGRGIPSYYSRDLLRWERGPQTIVEPPAWTVEAVPGNRGMDYWAPDIRKVGDQYFLYYSISTFGQRTSAIGLVSNATLDPNAEKYKWVDRGMVVQTRQSGSNYNAIDPAVMQDADGNLWLSFGSFWEGIKLIQLDPQTGKRIAPDSPMYSLAHYGSIEASSIYFHDGQYYLFVNWGRCCQGVNSSYNIRVGRSERITGPYRDMDGRDMMQDSGSLLLGTEGNLIGPGHAGILKQGDQYWFSFHFYDGSDRGASKLAIRPMTWNSNGWPKIGSMN